MIRRLKVLETACHDPYRNLALEQHLLETVAEGECILYLWQNEHTVVIGRNQNPWKECAISLLQQEGGRLVRRLSGGGAVYHDLGNLNFTFLMPQQDYDLYRQFDVILQAMQLLGIPADRSGRNDLLTQGRKFSGNAFYKNGKQAYHHGTLLVNCDPEKMTRYLTPSKAKLQGKGVDSVRSRVVNLKELLPDLTVTALKNTMADAFSRVYGLPVEHMDERGLDEDRIRELTLRNASWEWNFGKELPLSVQLEDRFPWGGVELQLQVCGGIVTHARMFTDAMDENLAAAVEEALAGSPLIPEKLQEKIRSLELPEGEDLEKLLSRCGA